MLCPICKKTTDLTKANPYRPFCNKRCRLIDLGQWIEEAYVMPEMSLGDDWQNDEHETLTQIKH